MTWTYSQHTGVMLDQNGDKVAAGYSGNGTGLNNPQMQFVVGHGPLPKGRYTIGAPKSPTDHLGPLAMPLAPAATNTMFGRSAFFIHGDNAAADHSASDGCIILPKNIRQMIADSDDRDLLVVT